MRKVKIFSFTRTGTAKNRELCTLFKDEGWECKGYAPASYSGEGIFFMPEDLRGALGEEWGKWNLLFIGAAGIAVRYIAPWVKDKMTDPAVLVMDERGDYVIPLLSGHVGGAAELARWIGERTGAVAIQTTATDVQGKFAVDVFAKRNHLRLTDRELAKKISAAVLEGIPIGLWIEQAQTKDGVRMEGAFPKELCLCRTREELWEYAWGIYIGAKPDEERCAGKKHSVLYLEPKDIVVGIGCRKGISAESLKEQAEALLARLHLDVWRVQAIASIDLKKEEKAIQCLAERWCVPFVTYPAENLRQTGEVTERSMFVEQTTGVDNVCERAARWYCMEEAENQGELIQGKWTGEKMTMAVVKAPVWLQM